MAGTYYNSHCNHAYHDNPSFYVEKGKGAVLPFLLCNTKSMFPVQHLDNTVEKQKDHQSSIADLVKPIMSVISPTGQNYMQTIDTF